MSDSKFCIYCDATILQTKVFETQKWDPLELAIKTTKDGLSQSVWTIVSITEQVFQCDGCKHLNLFIEECGDPGSPVVPKEYQFPQRKIRRQPSWIKDLHIDYFELLGEIYSNYNNQNFISFNICCRTIIDKILTDTLGDIGGFDKKLCEYHKLGHVTKSQLEILTILTDSGSAAAHRGFKASSEFSEILLDIIEHVLKEFILVKKSKLYASEIPKRK